MLSNLVRQRAQTFLNVIARGLSSIGLTPNKLTLIGFFAMCGIGILLAYGFVGPLGGLLEQKADEGTKMLQAIKVVLLANLNGYAPAMAVEFGRKVLNSTERPGFLELEAHVKQKR